MVPTGAEEQATVPRLSVLLWVNQYLLSSQALRLLVTIDHSTDLVSPAWFPGVWLSLDSPGSQLLCSEGEGSKVVGQISFVQSSRPSLLQMEVATPP